MQKRTRLLWCGQLIFATVFAVQSHTTPIRTSAQVSTGEGTSEYVSHDSKPHRTTSNNYLKRVSSFPYGPAISIAVDSLRHLIFASSGGAALVLDGSDPANLQLLTDSLRTDGLIYDVAYDYATQRLYFACGDGGFEIWDVQNPSHPFRYSNFTVTYFDVPVPVRHVQIRDNIAVVECSWGFVHSLNVTNPYSPFEAGFVGTMGNPSQQIYVEPTEFLHTTGQNGYYRYHMDASGYFSAAGSRYFLYGATAVFGTHDLAFVGYSGDMYILDLHTGAFLPWSVTDVNGTSHMEVRNQLAYITNSSGLNIWNVSNPTSPYWISTIPMRYISTDFVIAGKYLYAAERDYGFEIVDISDPDSPFVAGSYESLSITQDVHIDGNHVYLSHLNDGVLITDVSDLDRPGFVGQYDTPGTVYNETKVQGNILYVADWDGGFRIADVSNPANPVELSSVGGFNAWRVEAAGNYAYVIEGIPNQPDNLRIFDVTNPSSPVQLSMISIPGETNGIVFHGNHLYLASSDAGFQVIDVSVPTNPAIVSQLNFPTYVTDVYVRDSYAYVTSLGIGGTDSGLHIVDISDPQMPVQVGVYTDVALEPFDVEVSGEFAYLTDGHDLAAFRISSPSSPVYLESIRTPDMSYGIVAVDSLIFVADLQAGLQIYKNTRSTVHVQDEATQSMPTEFSLAQNYPNPFNPSTTIKYDLPTDAHVSMKIYNVLGQEVTTLVNEQQGAGYRSVEWNATNMASGVYFYRLQAGEFVQTKKLLLMK